MPSKDFFDTPFDEGTLMKLDIFEKYFQEWLPTFVKSRFKKPIRVFDFFAGMGYDINNAAGSPIRFLKIIHKNRSYLIDEQKRVHLYFNDIDSTKISQLKRNVEKKMRELSLNYLVEIKYTSQSFKECLRFYQDILKHGCNLIFIDQNGFKEVDEKVFQFLINLDSTEFIFFISSSYIHRFAGKSEVTKYHPKFDFDRIKKTDRKKVHNVICEEFHKYVPQNINNYGLIPFSIMKNDRNNVYGIIFVTKHILGADKFLRTVWAKNALNGNANFDIDDDLTKSQLSLFQGKIPTKIEKFKYDLRDKILRGEIKNNKDAYIFTISQGHIHQHANEEIRRMKENKLISYPSKSPLVNYEQVFRKKKKIEYKIS